MPRRLLFRSVLLTTLALGINLACSLALAEPLNRTALDEAYQTQLEQLAAKCDELQLAPQAQQTRAWFIRRLPDRQYLFLPTDRAPKLPVDAPELVRKWHDKFLSLRKEQAEQLFALAKAQLDQREPTQAYQLLHEALHEDPDHAACRAILGYTKVNGAWRHPGTTPSARKATLAHSYLKLPAGSYWRIATPHFQLTTTAGSAAGLQFGEQLETIHSVWQQVFFRYWSGLEELQEDFRNPTRATRPVRQHNVVLFKDRAEYLTQLAAAEPRLAVTQGIYLDGKHAAFFYQGDERAEAVCAHEATHQLFQETGRVAEHIAAKSNFWIVEGIALYMESLRRYDGYVTLGGWDADRLQFARHHVFNGQFQLPLEKLVTLGREAIQQDSDIKRLYSQSAGQAHYLMDDHAGQFRSATIDYLIGIYDGRDRPDMLAKLTDRSLAEHDRGYREFLKVDDADVASLPSPLRVRNLCLGHQAISDAALPKLGECQHLHWLDLAATQVTDAGLEQLRNLKALAQLNLEQTATTNRSLAWIGKLPALVELDLSQTQITDAGIASLAKLTQLQVLWLTGTAITEASSPTLQKLKQLETLDLAGTKLTPAQITSLRKQLPKLQSEP